MFQAVPTPPEEDSENGELSSEAAKALFLVNFLPFIGFGFLDNLVPNFSKSRLPLVRALNYLR